MSKLDELTGFLTAHNNPSVREAGYKMKALIERVEELERQLQSARELAEEVRDADVAANSDMSKADLRPSIYEWGCIARMAREFLELLEGK